MAARYQALARSGGKLFAFDPKTSNIRIYVFRGGNAANLGHSHVLSAPHFEACFYLPPDGARHAQFDLEFRLDQLEVDNSRIRAQLGGIFAREVSADDIAGTREHMLGERSLQAERFPTVHVHSQHITGDAPRFAADVDITLHGGTHRYSVPIRVVGLPERLSASGSLVLRQSDFGVQPYTVLGGLLAVEDEIVLEFELNGAG